jgi:hypothetical protein
VKTTVAKTLKSLPAVEWDFYELDEREALLAFYYEFGRDSSTVKAEVEKMRTKRSNSNVWLYCPRDHHLWEVLFGWRNKTIFQQRLGSP